MTLARAINNAHSAAADFFENLVIAESPVSIVNVDLVQEHSRKFRYRRFLLRGRDRGDNLRQRPRPTREVDPHCGQAMVHLAVEPNQ